MASNVRLSDAAANAGISAIAALLDGGLLRIYSGAQPANANASLAGRTLLATLIFSTPAFAAAVAGAVSAAAITADASMVATGIASFARLFKPDGVTPVLDLSVGTSGCDINFDNVSFVAGQSCAVSALTLRLPE
jgi:hypothetical protein